MEKGNKTIVDLSRQSVNNNSEIGYEKETSKTNKLGFFFLLFIFCYIYIMNLSTPLLVDDYFVSNVHSVADVIDGLKGYYFNWGGRVPGSVPVWFFLWKGKEYFNIFNAFMFTLLLVEIYWLTQRGKVSFSFIPSYLVGIFFSLWSFNSHFIDTCLWLSGAGNYLWMMVVVLAFLLPWVKCLFDTEWKCEKSILMSTGMLFLGILAGWSHESTIGWLILSLAYFMYLFVKENRVQNWQVSGFLGLFIGYCFLIFAPGNLARLSVRQAAVASQSVETFLMPSQVLYVKFVELGIILYFHMFLWYVIISFFVKAKRNFNYYNAKGCRYVVMSCVLIAVGSAVIMFFVPTAGLRPSFLGLVFLTIAAGTILREQEAFSVPIISEKVRKLFIQIGYCYLSVTMVLSLWCNGINGKQWNEVLMLIKKEHQKLTETVLQIEPYFTDKKHDFWLVGTGFHLIGMPVTENELHENNKLVAKYYGIKGIKIKAEKSEQ